MEYMLPLKDRKEIAEGTMEFWFDTTGTNFTFRAGQNGDWFLINPPYTDNEGTKRTFSFTNSPNDKGIVSFATRMRDSAFKNSLKEIPIGTKLKLDGPYGDFTLHQDTTKPAVFVIGGIGITPVRSIIAYATEQKLPHKIYLFYSNKTPASTAFLADLQGFAEANPNFTFVPTITDAEDPNWPGKHGRITAEMIKESLPDMLTAIYYLSGPEVMVKAMRELLVQAQVSEDNIKTEEFTGY